MKKALLIVAICSLFSQTLMASNDYAPLCRELKRETKELAGLEKTIQDQILLQEDLIQYYRSHHVAEKAFALHTAIQIAAWWSLFRLAYAPAQIAKGALNAGGSAAAATYQVEGLALLIIVPFIPVIASESLTIFSAEHFLNEELTKQDAFAVKNVEIVDAIRNYKEDYLLADLQEKHFAFKAWYNKSTQLISNHFSPTSLAGELVSAGFQETKRLNEKLELLKIQKAALSSLIEKKIQYANALATIGVQDRLDSSEYMDCLMVQIKK